MDMSETWLFLRSELARSVPRVDEDRLQEAVMRVWLRLGDRVAPTDGVRLGRKILRDLLVDEWRRRQPRLLGNDDLEIQAGPGHVPFDAVEHMLADVRLRHSLGERAVVLLCQLLRGVRHNKVLALHMNTSPAAIRRRRARIERILAQHLQRDRGESGTSE